MLNKPVTSIRLNEEQIRKTDKTIKATVIINGYPTICLIDKNEIANALSYRIKNFPLLGDTIVFDLFENGDLYLYHNIP